MNQYLRLYAEPEIAALDDLSGQFSWSKVLVIPACNESPDFLRPPPPSAGRSLIILVINQTEAASPKVTQNNRALAQAVRQQFTQSWHTAVRSAGFEMTLFSDPVSPRDILLVDRYSKGHRLPLKGGVGHARKIGADLAASLIQRKCIQSCWIHCSDADVWLPQSYFSASDAFEASSGISALVYPYQHRELPGCKATDEVLAATRLYEDSLRYYVAGLKFAGSPYAFHTIGSTMAVNAFYYAKVRGFPKREAGEDFYLLNKLAKVGRVVEMAQSADCMPITIAARRSDRVPFGTGAAINKITALHEPQSDFLFYDPEVFRLLKLCLLSLQKLWAAKSTDPGQCLPAGEVALHSALISIKAPDALAHALRQSSDQDQFFKQMHTWFDAFRTLKLIHYLRDHHLPSISRQQLSSNPIFLEIEH